MTMSRTPATAAPREENGLAGRRICVPESRALDLFAGMLERQGASAVRCPLVSIHDVEDAAPVEAWLRRLAAGEHDDLVLFTGEGVTRLLGFARRAGIEAEAVDALRRARKIVRGPKPAGALRRAGLSPDVAADAPTSDGLVSTLSRLDLAGRRVGVQLYPEAPGTVVDFLAAAGAMPDPVLCYRYASDEEDGRVAEVIREMAAGNIDLIAFTSSPQVRRLQQVARRMQLEEALDAAMRRTEIAVIGPVTGEAVERAGWRVGMSRADALHLKPFVRAMTDFFAACSGPAPETRP